MAKPMAAQDTFSVQLADGSSLRVSKGEVFPDSHEVVKLDGDRGHLFKPLDFGEPEPPAKSAPAKADPPKAEPAKATPVKAAGKVS